MGDAQQRSNQSKLCAPPRQVQQMVINGRARKVGTMLERLKLEHGAKQGTTFGQARVYLRLTLPIPTHPSPTQQYHITPHDTMLAIPC